MAKRGPLHKRVLHFIRKHGLIPNGGKVLVGVSGGPDSVCLVHILAQLREELGIELCLAHFNHQLRGTDSEADARYVSGLASSLGLPSIIEQQDVRQLQQARSCSLEEAAREMRYAFLGRAARSWGAGRVAVGHTADDQAETILMHIVRGTGLSGLRGMAPRTRWRSPLNPEPLLVVRPLLEVSHEETEAYCQSHQLSPRLDLSNQSPAYLRNRFRQQLLPVLQSFNPNIRQTLSRNASMLSDDYAFIQMQVTTAWEEVVSETDSAVVIHRQRFSGLHPAVQRHLLLKVLEYKLGSPQDLETSHVENMMVALRRTGKRVSLPGGLELWVGPGQAVLAGEPEAFCPLPPLEGENRVQVPGQTLLPGWKVATSILPGRKLRDKGSGYKAYLDLDWAGSDLVVRSRRQGDRLQPLGMGQVKKLQDFMVDARVPEPWRDRTPLVCSPQHILWVVGWRISEVAKITEATTNILKIEFRRR